MTLEIIYRRLEEVFVFLLELFTFPLEHLNNQLVECVDAELLLYVPALAHAFYSLADLRPPPFRRVALAAPEKSRLLGGDTCRVDDPESKRGEVSDYWRLNVWYIPPCPHPLSPLMVVLERLGSVVRVLRR